MGRIKMYIVLFAVFNFYTINAQSDPNYYIGAVVEYANINHEDRIPTQNIEANVEMYIMHIKQAKAQNADIVVFPECGLVSTSLTDSVLDYTSAIPETSENEIPCNSPNNLMKSWSTAIKRISCAAQEYKIYVVINLPERVAVGNEPDKNNIYNTNVVFDRKGQVIAKYRKFNLFNEPGFNITKEPELITFETDFGVTFGTFTCFDILFPQPALHLVREMSVTDIVYPTAWFSELPFLTAVQTQAGWARANGVNLLAAAYNDPIKMGGGSGIYTPNGIQNFSIPFRKETNLLVSRIRKIKTYSDNTISDNTNIVNNMPTTRGVAKFNTMTDNITNYKTKLIEDGLNDFKLCDDKFCCTFAIKSKIQPTPNYYYRAVVYDGNRLYGSVQKHIQVCAIVACTEKESLATCGIRTQNLENPVHFESISIRGDQFSTNNNTVQFPTTVSHMFSPFLYSEYNYCSNSDGCIGEIHINTIKEVTNTLGFGIYAIVSSANRVYSMVLPFVLIFSIFVHFSWNKL